VELTRVRVIELDPAAPQIPDIEASEVTT